MWVVQGNGDLINLEALNRQYQTMYLLGFNVAFSQKHQLRCVDFTPEPSECVAKTLTRYFHKTARTKRITLCFFDDGHLVQTFMTLSIGLLQVPLWGGSCHRNEAVTFRGAVLCTDA